MASLDAPPIIVAMTDSVIPLTQSDVDTDMVGGCVKADCLLLAAADYRLLKLYEGVRFEWRFRPKKFKKWSVVTAESS